MIKFTEYPLNPIHENIKYNLSLYQTTKFPYQHLHCVSSLSRRILSFRFRSIEFNKKRSLLFFLFLELVTGQKPIAITSSANIQKWKIRKGRLVGCKITLRKTTLHNFLDTLLLTFPRREKLIPFVTSFYSVNLSEKNQRQVKSAHFNFRRHELVFFYPIEATIGLHPDFQYIYITSVFSSFPVEERLYHLTSLQFPVK